MELVLL